MKKLFAIAVLSTAASIAGAAGDHVGAVLGLSAINASCPDSCERISVAGKLYLGTALSQTRPLTGEFGFIHFGQFEAAGFSKIKGYAGVTNLAWRVPVRDGVSVVGRVGAARVWTEWSPAGEQRSRSSWSPYGGASVDYRLTPAMALTGSVDAVRGRVDGDNGLMMLFGVGVKTEF